VGIPCDPRQEITAEGRARTHQRFFLLIPTQGDAICGQSHAEPFGYPGSQLSPKIRRPHEKDIRLMLLNQIRQKGGEYIRPVRSQCWMIQQQNP
jgi:hypothetical protein